MGRVPRLSQLAAAAAAAPPQPSRDAGLPHDSVRLSQHADLSREEVDNLIAEVMRYMLFKNYQQPGVPVRREELTQLITKNYKAKNLPNTVIQKAQLKFSSIFGYEMREIIRLRHTKSAGAQNSSQGAAEVKSYVLKSILSDELRMKFVENEETAAVSSFALLVVCILHICGEKIPEETLWLHLRRLGIKQEEEMHPVFGDIKQSLETLIKQRYIQKEKLSSPDGDTFVYELAEKALDNPVKTKLQGFISQMVHKEPGLGT